MRGRALSGIAAILALGASSLAQEAPAPGVRLIVSVSVDQMIPDHLERLAPWLEGGLGRFKKRGRVFAHAALTYGDTETAPGHSCVGTGLQPTRHGIVGNDWLGIDQSRATYCFEDPDACLVTDEGPREERASSPRNFRALGFAEHLRAASPNSRSFAISSKDRSAIGMSGRRADLALWWDKKRGGYATSTWYVDELPPWVRRWNAGWLERLARSEFRAGWKHELPEEFEGSRTAPDECEGEWGRPGERSFPHRTPKFAGPLNEKELASAASWVYDGPAGDVLVVELARVAQREFELGERDAVDLLCVSLSSCDTVGHRYGPYSVEVTDVLLRADRLLEELFDQLDERVGADHWVASLTADHGVMELPETLAARGIRAGRLSSRVLRDALDRVRPQVAARFGADFYLAHQSRGVRLSRAAMLRAAVDPAQVRSFYASKLQDAGSAWIEHVVALDELREIAHGQRAPRTELIAYEAASFDEERTCDLVVLFQRDHLMGVAAGTTHGTPHDYDRSIPLAFCGASVRAGRSDTPAGSIDVLPTLMSLADLPLPPGLDGRALDVRR